MVVELQQGMTSLEGKKLVKGIALTFVRCVSAAIGQAYPHQGLIRV